MSVRVRYGPSPTGEPHVGNIRTALFDWLLARRFGGQFIVRIEDTDQSRAVEGAEQIILDALTWLGLDWDEGPDKGGPFAPYRQSERLPMYVDAAQRLIADGKAYRCICTSERLDALRKSQQKAKQPPGYDRHCRGLDISADQPHVVRLAMPGDGDTIVNDYLRGEVSFQNALLDDHVLLKRDGFPTYHLASVVDDHHMEITHVIRGEEWLSSAPRHVQTYAALGWDEPAWVHIPIIRGPDNGKLSKRHGATSIREYAEQGFLPEALLNFLALLGWSKDETTTIMSRDEITESFDLDGLGLSSAMFDIERLQEMNARYIRDLDPSDFLRRGRPHLERRLKQVNDVLSDDLQKWVKQVDGALSDALQNRVKQVNDVLSDGLQELAKRANDVPSNDVQEVLEQANDGLSDDIQELVKQANDGLNGEIKELLELPNVGLSDDLQKLVKRANDGLSDDLQELLELPNVGLSDDLQRLVKRANDGLSDDLQELLELPNDVLSDDLQELLEQANDVLSDDLQELLEQANDVLSDDLQELLEQANDVLSDDLQELAKRANDGLSDDALDRLLPIATAIQERVKLMPEFADYTDFFFTTGPLDYDNAELMGRAYKNKPWAALESVEASLKTLRSVDETDWTTPRLESILRDLATQRGEKPGALFTPIRVATTGKRIAPPLFETLETLGQDLTVERLNAAAERLARPDD